MFIGNNKTAASIKSYLNAPCISIWIENTCSSAGNLDLPRTQMTHIFEDLNHKEGQPP